MAERPGELNTAGSLDPLAVNAGAGTSRYPETSLDDRTSDMESREMMDNTGEHPPETEHIRTQIEETRRELGETIDAIQERLSFSNMSEQVSETVSNAIETAKDTIYDATIGKAVDFMRNTGDGIANSGVVRTARENPFPLLLIGLGAGLLAYQSFSGGRRRAGFRVEHGRDRYLPAGRRDDPKAPAIRVTDESLPGRALHTVTDAASSALDTASQAAGTAYESVSGTLTNAYTGAGEFVGKARETASEYGSKAYETYDYYLEENPLAVAAVAAALGVAVGFAIPATRFEGELVGEYREDVLNKAQEQVNTLIDKAKHVATEAGQTIKEEAQQALNT